MKRLLPFVVIIFWHENMYGQKLAVKDFLSASYSSSKKMDGYLKKNEFIQVGREWQNDTIVNTYGPKMKNKSPDSPAVTRTIATYIAGKDFSYSFQTSSKDEYIEARNELKNDGFYCGNENDASLSYLYQHKNTTVQVTVSVGQDDTLYSFHFSEKELQPLSKVRYADDLLEYTSHEYLVSVFGEKNVKKDLYYFSEKEIAKCSVLFPRTERQAVFIWGDEINLCHLSNIVIGGNVTTESSVNYNKVISENRWISKEGVYSGMSLPSLTKLNGNDFKFYGKNSEFPYMVVPENTGKINFKKNVIVLSCLSVNNSPFLNKNILTATDALNDNTSMFVYMYMLTPPGNNQ
ncbi:MAG: hypothetical protein ABUT20_01800 [Bacteroidota bacterium]